MNCAEFREIVHELARRDASETLGQSTAVMAQLHAQICNACASRLVEARTLAQSLSDAAEDSKIWEAPAGIEERLAGAFREHHRNLAQARSRERRTRLRWAEWIAFAAAALALAAIGAWNFSRGPVVRNVSATPSVSSAANPDAGSAAQDAFDDPQIAGADGNFVPLPYSESPSAEDSGLVVRVSMTRGTLATLGYPVDEMSANELIQADVMIGDDGLPLAVRLVQ